MIEPAFPLPPKITYIASFTTATSSLGPFIFVSPFRRTPLQLRSLCLYVAIICTYTRKKSPARATDFPNYIGEGYSIKTILEAVLRFL